MRDFATPCLVCGKLARGSSRCEQHQAEANARRDQRRDSLATVEKKRIKYNSSYRKKAKEIRDFVKLYGGVCYLCKNPLTGEDTIHVDHVYPEQGIYSPLAPVHKRCNESKGGKSPDLYRSR